MTVVVTGGGSAGHVTPGLAVVEIGQERNWQVHYIGSSDGIERELATGAGLPYSSIRVGKLRRYFSWRNFVDPFLVVLGILDAWRLLATVRPQAVFSKGGFVGFPVVVAAWLRGIPVVAHESDMSMGLANRLSLPFITALCLASEAAHTHRFKGRVEVTGNPIRRALFLGDRVRGLERFGLRKDRKTVLVFGGSLGARSLNTAAHQALPLLPDHLQIVHVAGAGNLLSVDVPADRYAQFEYLQEEFPDALASADVVVCRAGANSLAELLALRIPSVLVPLPLRQSRGDQLLNAQRHVDRGFGLLLADDELNGETLLQAIAQAFERRSAMVEAMRSAPESGGARRIADVVEEVAGAAH